MPLEAWFVLFAVIFLDVLAHFYFSKKGNTMENVYFSEIFSAKQDGSHTILYDLRTDKKLTKVKNEHVIICIDIFHSLLTLDNLPARRAAFIVANNYDSIVDSIDDPIDEISAKLIEENK